MRELQPGNRLSAALIVFAAIGAAFLLFSRNEEPARKAGSRVEVPTLPVDDPTVTPGSSTSGSTGAASASLPTRRLTGSVQDPLGFMRSHALRAFDGDAEAQYLIGRTSIHCESTLSLVRKDADPEAAIWRVTATWPQSLRDWTFAEFQRCAALLKQDPFADLPARPGGYPSRYWLDRAADSGHPVAVVSVELSRLQADRVTNRAESIAKITTALLSADPDAPLMLGSGLLASADERLRIEGAAWMLVGCRAGGDCGEHSAVVPLGSCAAEGDAGCPPGLDVETYIGAALGADAYARAFRLHEELARTLERRDADAIQSRLDF